MKIIEQIQNGLHLDNLSNVLLYALIMLAGIDYTGVLDYVIKAILGAAVWFGFKLLQDYYSLKIKRKHQILLKKQRKEKP